MDTESSIDRGGVSMDMKELYRTCRSYRSFKQEPVPQDVIDEMMENARIASCAMNQSALRYVVVQSEENVAKMQDMVGWAGFLKGAGTPKEGHQPVLFITMSKADGANAMTDIDLGIAANTIVTTAWAHGLGSCILGNINKAKIKDLLDIPENEELSLVLAFGKPDHESTIVEMNDGDVKYTRDENGNYFVPKRKMEEIVRVK